MTFSSDRRRPAARPAAALLVAALAAMAAPVLRAAPPQPAAQPAVTVEAVPVAGIATTIPMAPSTGPSTSVDAACRKLTEKLLAVPPGTCEEAGLSAAPAATSLKGEPLLYRDFVATNRRGTGGKQRRVLLIGGTHGDELSSVAVVFDWMQRLERERNQSFYWRVIPCLNPDGVLASPSVRMNGRGVDLNRNLPTPDWAAKSKLYWEKRTRKDPRRYPGASAASEPETQWLLEQIKSYKPDAIVSIHAPYGLLDFDGPRSPPQKLGFLTLKDLGTYPGSLGSYAGEFLAMPILTLELPEAEAVPTTGQNARIWSDLLTWLEANLPKGQAPEFERLEGGAAGNAPTSSPGKAPPGAAQGGKPPRK